MISNMSKLISEDILAFKERRIESNYSVIFMGATHIPVKKRTVSKEAGYIVIGTHIGEPKKVLGFNIPQSNQLISGKNYFKILKFVD
ncbi:transposase [Enterococcus alishanensis]|uniref:transposase n=1 Tax=Enterococcus alishanensis TaxID=1303817 RepID=UPI003CCEB538